MPFFKRDTNAIITDGLRKLNENTNITQTTRGGKARFFLQNMAVEQGSQHAVFDQNLLQAYIQYAGDRFLDFFGDMLSLPRLEASNAEATDDNFMFYVTSGTFGDINNGQSFTIPTGTKVSTKQYEGDTVTPGLTDQPVITYSTTRDTVCSSSASFVYAPIRADIEGRVSSVPRNVITVHPFTSYTLGSTGALKCTNRYAIDNGDERETAGAYRYRLLQVFKSKEKATLAAIELAALSIPGVNNLRTEKFEQGPGTYSLYVLSSTPTTSTQLLRNVSDVVKLVTAEGIRAYVLAPRIIGTEFVVGVNWNPRTKTEDRASQYAAIRNAIEVFLNSSEIGEALDLNELISVALNAAPGALSIGKSTPNKFEEIYIYRTSPDNVGTVRSKMTGDFISPLYNERIILETSNTYRGIQFI